VNRDGTVYSVSELTGALKRTLESGYGRVRVRGEISGFRRPASGHLYFALKDQNAQLRAVMFRGAAAGLRFLPADGLEVEAEGEISLYEPRGDLQIILRRMEPSGLGALMRAFEELKRRLAAEGLFDPAAKRPLPAFPRTVALITSPTGAAVRDLIHVLRRRWPAVEIVLFPVRVQGEGAAGEIARALDRMDRWGGADVAIVGRGGGSLEDLWAFNEEPVARALAACRTPVVSAVGHETDFTIADLVADERAATPSAAAERVVPDHRELQRRLRMLEGKLARHMRGAVDVRAERLRRLVAAYGFRRPERFLRREQQRVDELAARLRRSTVETVRGGRHRAGDAARRLAGLCPAGRARVARVELRSLDGRLRQAAAAGAAARRSLLGGTARALDALDPTGVLARGYCLARRPDTGRILRSAEGLASGAPLVVQFHRDRAHTRVERVEAGGPPERIDTGKGDA
jgi:exodeoxyribonuclease VII large subunit